jgi:hypothetical protein
MTATELRQTLATIGWTQRGLAKALRCSHGLVHLWARDSAPLPAPVAAWLDTLATTHRAHPPPDGFRKRPGRTPAVPGLGGGQGGS